MSSPSNPYAAYGGTVAPPPKAAGPDADPYAAYGGKTATAPSVPDALAAMGASPDTPPFIDKLTEIQKPDSSKRWSFDEAVKAIGNIGAGGLGLLLHPYESAKAALAPLAAALPSYTLVHGVPVPVPNPETIPFANQVTKSIADNPYGTVEAGIGQAAVTEALPRVLKPVAEGAQSVAESGVRRLAGSGPGVASKLARQAVEENRVIDLHNADKMAEAQQKHVDAVAKAAADHKAELLQLRQKYAQATRDAAEKARTGTAADREQYQAKQLAAKQKYEQSVRDANEKHTKAVSDARAANAEAQRQYNQNIGKVAQKNREITAAERAKAEQDSRLQVTGSQLIYGLQRLDQALRSHANTLYNALRERMASTSLPSDTLADGVKAAQQKWIRGSPEKVREFNAMLSTGGPGPELVLADQTAQNMGYKDFRSAITNPQIRSTLSRVLPPDVWEAAVGQGTRPISWNDLQGFYEETGARIADGPQPGKADIYKALQDVHQFIGDQMQQMANAQGKDVGQQFLNARKFYREYMDTFHEPTGPSGSGSPVAQALLAKDPLTAVDKFAGDAGDRGIANLRRYSDSLANLAQDARKTAQSRVSVPSGGRGTAVDIKPPKIQHVPSGPSLPLPPVMEPAPGVRAANLPLPPVLPEPETVPFRQPKLSPRRVISGADLQRANEAAVRARAASLAGHLFWWTGVWPAFRMLSELSRGAEVSAKPLALMPAAGAAGMAAEELMGQPAVMEFLTRATRQQVARIPPELRSDMPDVVAMAKKRGIQVSPVLAAYAATIQRNRGQQDQSEAVPSAAGAIQ